MASLFPLPPPGSRMLAGVVLLTFTVLAIASGLFVGSPDGADPGLPYSVVERPVYVAEFNWVNPAPAGVWFHDVSFTEAGSGIIVGQKGTIIGVQGDRYTDLAYSENRSAEDLRAVTWSPDGTIALMSGNGPEALLYRSGHLEKLLVPVEVPDPTVTLWSPDVSFHPSGDFATFLVEDMLFDYSLETAIWNNVSATINTSMDGRYPRSIAWHPSGSYALIAGDNVAAIYDGSSFTILEDIPTMDFPRRIEWRPDGSEALVTNGQRLYRFDGSTFSEIPLSHEVYGFLEAEGGQGLLYDVAYIGDGPEALIVGGYFGAGFIPHGTVVYFDGSTGLLVHDIEYEFFQGVDGVGTSSEALVVGITGAIYRVPVSGDSVGIEPAYTRYVDVQLESGRWKPGEKVALVVGTFPGDVMRYDGKTMERVPNLPQLFYYDVAWNPREPDIAVITACDFSGHSVILRYDDRIRGYTPVQSMTLSNYGHLRNAAWNPDGSYALIGGDNGELLRYDGGLISVQLDPGNDATVNDIAFHPSGSHALVAMDDGIYRTDGSSITRIDHPGGSTALAWHPSGDYALVYNGSGFETYREGVFEPVSGSERGSSGWRVSANSIAFHPSGDYAVFVSSGEVGLFDGTSYLTFQPPTKEWLGRVDMSSTGTALVTGNWGVTFTFDGRYIEGVQRFLEWSREGEGNSKEDEF